MYNTFFLDHAYVVSLIVIAVVLGVGFALHRYSRRVSKEDSHMSQFVIWIPQLFMVVLISVWLNNLFQAVRERDAHREQRAWEVRQSHLVRLQTVLRADVETLAITARKATTDGRISGFNKGTAPDTTELESLMSPDLLTADLANHYPAYWEDKQQLWKAVQRQDAEFGDAVEHVSKTLQLPSYAENRRIELGRNYLAKCLDKGQGFTLTVSEDGYSYTSLGGGGSNSGGGVKPPHDIIAAFNAFQSISPDSETMEHCRVLKSGAASISHKAAALSAEAKLLAERGTLTGDCDYTKLE